MELLPVMCFLIHMCCSMQPRCTVRDQVSFPSGAVLLTCCQEVIKGDRWQLEEVSEAVQEGADSQHVAALLLGQVSSKGWHQVEAGGRELRPLWQVAAALVWLIFCTRSIPASQSALVRKRIKGLHVRVRWTACRHNAMEAYQLDQFYSSGKWEKFMK